MYAAITALAILAISLLGGIFLSRRNSAKEEGHNKTVLFVLYFWVLAFLQLIIFAVAYSLLTK